jgi:hypothetical protein
MQDSILNITVSAFRDYNTPTDPAPVNLLHWLNSTKYQNEVAAIRAEKEKPVRDAIKATLPGITASGTFSYRSARCLIQHSGLIAFDIDFKENSHITNYSNLKAEICKIVNVAYCGLSVSGTGFWGLIPIAYPDRHKQHFNFISNAFKGLGIKIDELPKNVAALRGYSYDADAYFNYNAKKLEQYQQPNQKPKKSTLYSYTGTSTQSDVEAIINEITKKGIDVAPNYNEWLNIGFAFASEFGESGRQYFHDVSRNYNAYDFNETNDQFNKCVGSSGSGITIKTFFHVCKSAGIELPKKEKPVPVKTIRIKAKQSQPAPLHLNSTDINSMLGNTCTGADFSKIIIQGYKFKSGKVYDVLFTERGELLKPGEQPETVKKLGSFFEKTLQPAMFDTNPCWVHLDKRFIINKN